MLIKDFYCLLEEDMSGECGTHEKKRNKYRILVTKIEGRADFFMNAFIT
jgi:hypothetical protein